MTFSCSDYIAKIEAICKIVQMQPSHRIQNAEFISIENVRF